MEAGAKMHPKSTDINLDFRTKDSNSEFQDFVGLRQVIYSPRGPVFVAIKRERDWLLEG